MNNKFFIIALIISIFFHYWIINIFSDQSDKWKYPEEKKETVISARLEFLASDSFSLLIEENPNQNLDKHNTPLETISTEKEMITQKDLPSENISKEEQYGIEYNLSEMKEIIDEQLPSYKYKSTEQNGTSNSQEIENRQKTPDNILTDNKVDQDKEYYKEVTNQDSLLLREERGIKSIQKYFPLDLTNSNLIDNLVTMPQIISYHPPEYPDNLRKRNIEGQVQLKVLVDKEGNVSEVLIDTFSGYRGFDQAAFESIFHWKFKSAKYDDEEKDSWVLIPIIFKLK